MKNEENLYSDFVVVGAGVVGLAIARELLIRNPERTVTVLDKETTLAAHASGRNSGVLHAGFYYSPDSLKARLTATGNQLLKGFCEEYSIPVRRTGKLVLAVDESEVSALHELLRRGRTNGVQLEQLDQQQLAEMEPRVAHAREAIWSPNTAVANPSVVVTHLAEDVRNRGGKVLLNHRVRSASPGRVRTGSSTFYCGHIVNSAGLYADRVAEQFGMCDDYSMLPFKGLYWYAPQLKGTYRHLIYPVPDARNPFLGVHLTVTVDGDVKVGPTAIPALSRENYRRIQGLSLKEVAQIAALYPGFLKSPHHDVRSLIATELPKLIRRRLVEGLRRLVPDIDVHSFSVRGNTGIRAQLLHRNSGRLEMDFVVRGDEKSTHVLNAVSPAWTSALSFASHVVDTMRI